tara:strand:- start:167 stop:289 length:123 start_codon:yes stop_codon:yes gene_type:complete
LTRQLTRGILNARNWIRLEAVNKRVRLVRHALGGHHRATM